MKKLTVGLIGLAFLLCAFSVQTAGAVDVYGVASAPVCTTDANCSDGLYCNGVEKCTAGVCGVPGSGTPPVCSGGTPYCDDINDKCSECLSDANCSDGLYCNGDEECKASGSCAPGTDIACSAGTVCNEALETCTECTASDTTNCAAGEGCNANGVCVQCLQDSDCRAGELCNADGTCVQCLQDSDCAGDDEFCNGIETCNQTSQQCVSPGNPCSSGYCNENTDSCVECLSDDNCTDDGNPCNGDEVCKSGTCGSTGNPCQDQICIPNNTISPPDSPAPLPYICVNCDNDTQCDDGVYCNGFETCNETAGQCVPGQQACQGQICDEANDRCVECLGDDNCTEPEPFCVANTCVACRNDADCDNGTFCDGAEDCVEGSCGAGTPPCAGQICDEQGDRCVECLNDNNCGGEEPYCSEGLTCVQCLEDFDCTDNESCIEGVCGSACALHIKPAEVRRKNLTKSVQRTFIVTGDEGFDPRGEIDFGSMLLRKAYISKKGVLRVRVIVPAGEVPQGPYEVRVGNCTGTIIFR